MNRFLGNLVIVAATAWTGALWGIGYIAAPVLFKSLGDRQLAGMVAGHMFSVVAYVGIVCALILLAHSLYGHGRAAFKRSLFRVVVIMLLLTLIGQFGLQPMIADLKAQALPLDVMQSAYSGQFKILHGIASILYLIQSLLGIALVLKARSA